LSAYLQVDRHLLISSSVMANVWIFLKVFCLTRPESKVCFRSSQYAILRQQRAVKNDDPGRELG
jgi:hypothetical protein